MRMVSKATATNQPLNSERGSPFTVQSKFDNAKHRDPTVVSAGASTEIQDLESLLPS